MKKNNLLFVSLLATTLLLAGCTGNSTNNGGNGSGSNSQTSESGGSSSSGSTQRDYADVYFYIDYNNVDQANPYLKVQVKWGSKITKPADPTTAPDPAYPTFLGWSERPVVDDTKYLYDFETTIKNKTYDFVLYGIWVATV